MQSSGHPSKRYFSAIDGLRLITSLNIVLFHLYGIGGLWDLRERPEWLFRLIKGPAFHASVFFLLGGFIFTVKFADRAANFNNKAFLKKRFLELYPLHLITTLVMAGLKVIYLFPSGDLDVPKLLSSIFMHLSLLWSLFPFGTYPLNRPSWALSAFFFCYILFGPSLKVVMKIRRKRSCMFYAAGCMLPLLLWGLLYGALGTPEKLYFFFHIFAPVRFFEFLLGMILGRFFVLTNRAAERSCAVGGLINDLLIIAAVLLANYTLGFRSGGNGIVIYLSYHFFAIPIYFTILYLLALEKGCICTVLSIPIIRKTGRSSFYPYLIHIPLISVIAYICEHGFGYYQFLHRPLNILVFLIVLYSGAGIYVNRIRKRKPSGPETVRIED